MNTSLPSSRNSVRGQATVLMVVLISVIAFAVAVIGYEATHSNSMQRSKGDTSFPGTGLVHDNPAPTTSNETASNSDSGGGKGHKGGGGGKHHHKGKHKTA